ncbi:MAG TPA: hypothetical protein DCL21_07195 [Alphaproteobacteria bacterium]|nr:hypothetical protein [Alphaproteobacteria bacterium]
MVKVKNTLHNKLNDSIAYLPSGKYAIAVSGGSDSLALLYLCAKFSKDNFIAKSNSYLANDLGNLFQRVLSFAHKNFDGKIPALGELTTKDKEFLAHFDGLADRVVAHMNEYKVNKAIDEVWACVRLSNKYMEDQHPWTYKKEDPAKCGHILRVLMESFKFLACLTQPFIPTGAEKLIKQLGYEKLDISDLKELIDLETGKEFDKPEGVFMRIQAEEK